MQFNDENNKNFETTENKFKFKLIDIKIKLIL